MKKKEYKVLLELALEALYELCPASCHDCPLSCEGFCLIGDPAYFFHSEDSEETIKSFAESMLENHKRIIKEVETKISRLNAAAGVEDSE